MASGLFKKIAKAVLTVGGTILGMVVPKIGGALVVAGQNIEIDTPTSSTDPVSVASANLKDTIQQSQAMGAASKMVGTTDVVMLWIKQYWIYIVAGLAALFLLPKLLKRGRR